MIRILHTGDLHLDTAFHGLSSEQARERRSEQRKLLERMRLLVEERNINVVLIAGDLFDSDSVYYETTHMLADELGRMKAHVFIAPGNHDPYSEFSPYLGVAWPENVHLFQSDYFERVELPELGAVVYGTAFTSKYRDDAPLERFKADYDDNLVRLMVLHGDVTTGRSRYGAIRPDDLGRTGMDYVALGHIHQGGTVQKTGETCYAYCGCPEGRGFDETGDKGVIVAEVERGSVRAEFVPICGRRYEEVTVQVDGKEAGLALLQALPQNAASDIYRFRLVGERAGDRPDPAVLERKVKNRFYSVQVIDETVPVQDLWEREDEDSLTGLFLRQMRDRMNHASSEEMPILERAVRYGLAALEGREEPR